MRRCSGSSDCSTPSSPTAATGAPPSATRAADAFLVPFERARGGVPGARRPASGSALRVDGAEVSAVTRTAGGLTVRVFRTAAESGEVTIEHEGAPARGWIVDLAGRPVAPFEGGVELRPWEICTLQLS